MTNNLKITAVIAIVAVVGAIVAVYHLSNPSTPRSTNIAPVEGSVSQAELDRATASLKAALATAGGADFDFRAEPTYGHYANFGIMQNVNEVKSVGLVDEMAITFRGKTDNDNAEVDPKTAQVVSFHREIDYNSTAKEKTQTEIESAVRTFLNTVYPNFKQVEPTLTFAPGMKGVRLNNGNYFFSWEDQNYQKQLPTGVTTDRAPFIQVGITSSGYVFSYDNTVDLYRNALKEFSLTQ